jgi:hypothetical protein
VSYRREGGQSQPGGNRLIQAVGNDDFNFSIQWTFHSKHCQKMSKAVLETLVPEEQKEVHVVSLHEDALYSMLFIM